MVGAVLVGGAGRRMGGDKAMVGWRGAPLGRRSVEALVGAGLGRVLLVGATADHLAALSVPGAAIERCADLRPGAGPAWAVRTAMVTAGAHGAAAVAVLPCDLPLVDALTVGRAIDAWRAAPGRAVILDRHGRPAAAGVWPVTLSTWVGEVLDAGGAALTGIIPADAVHLDGGPALEDADTPSALRRALRSGTVPTGTPLGVSDEERNNAAMDVAEIDVAELAARHAEGAAVLDVRQPDEYQAGHVPGAVLIPLGELPDRLGEVPDGSPLFVICHSGGRSRRACEFLTSAGRVAVNVAGGTEAWRNAGREVVTGSERG